MTLFVANSFRWTEVRRPSGERVLWIPIVETRIVSWTTTKRRHLFRVHQENQERRDSNPLEKLTNFLEQNKFGNVATRYKAEKR